MVHLKKGSTQGLLVVATIIGVLVPYTATAGPAYIWLSESNLNPAPEVPTLDAVVGTPRMLQIWARPATDINGDYRNLRNFSLDILPQQATIDLLDMDVSSSPMRPITVYNPAVGGSAGRFEYLNDSSADPELKSRINGGGFIDAILGLGGFTLESTTHAGVGTSCDPNDPFCGSDGSDDAFLLASFSYTPLAAGPAQLMFQIGLNGMSHGTEPASDTEVIFGDPSDVVYNAISNRQTTLPGDTFDAIIFAAPSSVPTTWSGAGGNWATPLSWSTLSVPNGTNDAIVDLDPGETLTVTGKQAANDTQVNAGQLHVDSTGSLASNVTVAAAGAISGDGWIMGDLDNSNGGTHVIDLLDTLRVSGAGDVTGAHLALADSYSQPAGSITVPFDILQAANVVGTFVEMNGAYLGQGIFLASINHDVDSVSVQLRNLPGDYNGDGTVNGADYSVWKGAFGTLGVHPADGDLDGVVNAADYVVWRNNEGNSVFGSGGGAAAVPEPGSVWLCAVAGLALGRRGWQSRKRSS